MTYANVSITGRLPPQRSAHCLLLRKQIGVLPFSGAYGGNAPHRKNTRPARDARHVSLRTMLRIRNKQGQLKRTRGSRESSLFERRVGYEV